MVDVGDKPATERRAVARAVVRVTPRPPQRSQRGDAPKGDVLGVARIAGIQAAKRTVGADPAVPPAGAVLRRRRGHRSTPTRGEIELRGRGAHHRPDRGRDGGADRASVAALTVYDMVKGIERGAEIASVALLAKSGGRSGEWRRS